MSILIKARPPRKIKRRVDGRWRLDFSNKKLLRDKPETDDQRRARIKKWLEHNYPHVMRTGGEDAAE